MWMLSDRLRVLYLHGFASGPTSRKATFFAAKLRALGFPVDIPDLAEDNFRNLTLTGQLRVIERLANNEPVILIGSSMGGYLASLYAAEHPEVDRLILLAPAFAFHELWVSKMSDPELTRWRQNGSVDVFHYGAGREMPLGYGMLKDASQYEPFPAFTQPALIFHGEADTSVPVQYSVNFINLHPNANLVRLPSGHELTDVLDRIWQDSQAFLLAGRFEIEC
ncbi:MAG: hypothetical protein JWP08_3919 [Bryobacterales bacterium]|nr:hypothetical protein [Bryobacterales bacterium]